MPKVGDKIKADRQTIGTNGSIANADKHAYWTLQKSDGTTSKSALDGRVLTITKIEKRKDGVKITADYDLANESKSYAGQHATYTRIIKNTDKMRVYK